MNRKNVKESEIENISIKENLSKISQYDEINNINEENNPLINIDVNLGENISKKLTIYSNDDIDKKIHDFCLINDLPSEAEKPLHSLLFKELNSKISQCK